jgi:2-dehydropantoate 2-reductase
MDRGKRICVIGAGAIGGVVAAILTREGHNVQLVTKYPELADKISKTGIQVSGHCGDFTIRIPSVAGPGDLDGVYDYVLIATKAEALLSVATEILPYINENSRVVSMQNGICEEILAGVVGEERTVGCVVAWDGTMHEPGKVEMTSDGEFILGNWNRAEDNELKELARMLKHVASTRISEHILSELYSKLIINSCITTLGAVCGLYLGECLQERTSEISLSRLSVRQYVLQMRWN